MSEHDSLNYKLRNQKKTPDIEAHGGEPRNATAEESQLNPAVYQLGYAEENVEADVAQSEQQSASIDVMGEISQNANALITIVNEYIPRSAGLFKTLDANFKRTIEHQKASNEKLVEVFQKKASEPREVDISDKKAPEEKSFMEKIKDTIASSCGIAKNVLFDAGKAIVKPVGAGIIKFVSSPVGAGLTFGAGVATAGAGVAYMASRNPKGVVDPRWLEGLNKSNISNEKLAGLISKYWQKHGGPDDPEKISWFIGSVVGESQLKLVREYAPKGKNAQDYFNQKYGGENSKRLGLGNGSVSSGDGYRFRGGGFIQLTGRSNYEKTARLMGLGSAEELADKIGTDLEVAMEASIIYFLKRPGSSEIPVKAPNFTEALRRIGKTTQKWRETRNKAREKFMSNVNNYPITTPDYNNGIATESPDDSFINQKLYAVSKKYIGLKYASKKDGTWIHRGKPGWADCSSLVSRLIKDLTGGEIDFKNGTTQSLVKQGSGVSSKNIKPGDMVFWNNSKQPNGHVELYIGGGKTIGTNDSKYLSRIRSLNENGRQPKISAVRRITKVYNIINA